MANRSEVDLFRSKEIDCNKLIVYTVEFWPAFEMESRNNNGIKSVEYLLSMVQLKSSLIGPADLLRIPRTAPY